MRRSQANKTFKKTHYFTENSGSVNKNFDDILEIEHGDVISNNVKKKILEPFFS